MSKLSKVAQNKSAQIAGAAGAMIGSFKRIIASLGLTIGNQFVTQLHYLVVHGEAKSSKALRKLWGPWYGVCYRMNEAVATIQWTADDNCTLSQAVQIARANVTNCVKFSRAVMLLFAHNRDECASLTDPSLRKPSNSEGKPSKVAESFSNRLLRIETLNNAYCNEQGFISDSGRTLADIDVSDLALRQAKKINDIERKQIIHMAMEAEFNTDMSEFTMDLKVPTTLPKEVVAFVIEVKQQASV
jgi:hypothetical protein